MTKVDEKLDRHIILLSLWILDICSTLPESDTMTVPPYLSLLLVCCLVSAAVRVCKKSGNPLMFRAPHVSVCGGCP